MMSKSIATIAILFLFSIGTKEIKAQKFYGGMGYSLFTDIVVSKPIKNPGFADDEREDRVGVNVFSFSVDMKFNVHQFNRNLALSIATSPCFGIGNVIEKYSLGNVRIPVYAQLDYGNLSTSKTNKDFGVGIGIGYEYDIYNLTGDKESFSFNTISTKLAFRFNFRHELAFKIGLPKQVKMPFKYSKYVDGKRIETDVYTRITYFQLSYIRYW